MKKLLVVLLVLGMVAPAMAAEWNFYGSARAGFWYNDYSKEASGVYNDQHTALESDTDLNYFVQSNSRIGANVKTSDAVTGRFEYGTGVNLRLLYGEYHFGGGSLLLGQDYTPVDTLYSNQAADTDNGLLYEGMAYEGRQGQLKLKMGGFQAALIPAHTGHNTGAEVKTRTLVLDGTDVTETYLGTGSRDVDVLLPKIELSYDMKMDTISVGGFAGYQTYSARYRDPLTLEGGDYDVNAWVVGLRGKFNFGPAYVNFCGWYGQNASDYGMVVRMNSEYATLQTYDKDHTEDATTYAAALAIGSKFNDMVAIEAGIGYIHSEVDDPTPSSNTTYENAATTYYVQLPITLAPGVFIVPEISIYDYGDAKETGADDEDLGQLAWYGAKFQINF